MYQIFTTRAAAEIERKAALDRLTHSRFPNEPDAPGIEEVPYPVSNVANT
ncbi:hypothetical protein [Paraburkholderia phymatum]|nr:hypothetical protein [Paraburkholderia phymatum]